MGQASRGPQWRELMSNLTKLLAGAFLVMNLAACGSMSSRERSTVVGAGVGTAIGAAVTGDVGGAVGGGVVGGVIGNQIGR